MRLRGELEESLKNAAEDAQSQVSLAPLRAKVKYVFTVFPENCVLTIVNRQQVKHFTTFSASIFGIGMKNTLK